MELKLFGALCILSGCFATGCAMAVSHKRNIRFMRQLISALDFMECELQYHLTPLPELCCMTAKETSGFLRSVFWMLGKKLEDHTQPDVSCCMRVVLANHSELPEQAAEVLRQLGQSLGRFDLSGQLKGLESVRGLCRRILSELENDKENRMRSYQTLSLCAGAALAVLLI